MTKTIIYKDRKSYVQEHPFNLARFTRYFQELVDDMPEDVTIKQEVLDKVFNDVVEFITSFERVQADKLVDYIIRVVNDNISADNPELKWLSASASRRQLYKWVGMNRGFDYKKGYGDFYQLIKMGVEKGIYHEDLLKSYTKDEIDKIGKMIVPERDKLLDIAGMALLRANYLKKDYNEYPIELPQERYLVTVMFLMKDEDKKKRLNYIRKGYWATSNHYVGLATPTIISGGTPKGSLSSCQIVTLDDDLINIFDVLKETARFSQAGSGVGLFLGFLRANGSWIRGYKGRASGVTHPSRLMSVLAEYVNQLGSRNAGLSAYLPVWHGDILEFLDLKLKTGSQERRAHSIQTAVTIPDEFMRRLKKKEKWTLFDPYEFKKRTGKELNQLYDKKKLRDNEEPNEVDHAFTYWYRKAEVMEGFELRRTVSTLDIYKGIYISRKTGGTPYLYWHDTSARMNPNEHAGMPYGSNLCC